MSAQALQRLLAPRSLALVGGAWADAAYAASAVIGYSGQLIDGAKVALCA